MSTSPSAHVQAARQALANRLRELRLEAGLTAIGLAAAAGWERTKVSKIEHAARPPSIADINTWCRVCEAEDQAADFVAALRVAEGMYVEWKRLTRGGLRRLQESQVPLYERMRELHSYCSQLIPGLLQTRQYAIDVLHIVARKNSTQDDAEDAADARMERARVLRQGDRRFVFIIEESVLYYRLGSPEAMIEQLRHLLTVMSLPSVALAVIPFTVTRRAFTYHSFTIFGSEHVGIELISADVTITAPGEIAVYRREFQVLADMAVTGPAGRSLILKAIDFLSD